MADTETKLQELLAVNAKEFQSGDMNDPNRVAAHQGREADLVKRFRAIGAAPAYPPNSRRGSFAKGMH